VENLSQETSIIGGTGAVIGAKVPKGKSHWEIENPVDKKPIHFGIAKSGIPTK
jgi:hypothetical protein